MRRRINIILDHNSFLGQELFPWASLDVGEISTWFRENGIEVNIQTLQSLQENKLPEDQVLWFTSSQKPDYKLYIEDLIFSLNGMNNYLIPSRDILKAHDNKGFQELLKSNLNINDLKSRYYGSIDEVNFEEINYPVVLKKPDGAGSHGVFLINSRRELERTIRKLTRESLTFIDLKTRFKDFLKYYLFRNKYNTKSSEYKRKNIRFVLQKFISNLKFDYKILIFYDRYFVLKRYTKPNDFRASGSGIFKFEDIDSGLLDYAKNIFATFNVPHISLDVCFDGRKYYLIEFQGTHFGPYTLQCSEGFYSFNETEWQFNSYKSVLEVEYCRSIFLFLKEKGIW
jgi:glutathione synthase/RimK-type ligase-like ATP-grasp enzyme